MPTISKTFLQLLQHSQKNVLKTVRCLKNDFKPKSQDFKAQDQIIEITAIKENMGSHALTSSKHTHPHTHTQ